jgi:O-antigen ligase
MGLLVPLSLTAHTDVRVFARRGLLLLVPAAVCIAASGSRTGLLVTVVGLAVLALVAGPLRVPAAAGALLVIAATLVFSFTPLEPQGGGATGFLGVQNNPGLHRSRLTTVLGARNEAWSEAARIIKRRPVEGYGFGTGEDRLFDRFHAHFTWFEGGGPSDAYVQAVMDVGLVGVVILLVPLAAAAARALRRPPGPVWPSVMLAGTLVGAVFESIFASPGAPFSYFVWFSTAALLMRVMSHPSVPATT